MLELPALCLITDLCGLNNCCNHVSLSWFKSVYKSQFPFLYVDATLSQTDEQIHLELQKNVIVFSLFSFKRF
jgi:hypothetical protein